MSLTLPRGISNYLSVPPARIIRLHSFLKISRCLPRNSILSQSKYVNRSIIHLLSKLSYLVWFRVGANKGGEGQRCEVWIACMIIKVLLRCIADRQVYTCYWVAHFRLLAFQFAGLRRRKEGSGIYTVLVSGCCEDHKYTINNEPLDAYRSILSEVRTTWSSGKSPARKLTSYAPRYLVDCIVCT